MDSIFVTHIRPSIAALAREVEPRAYRREPCFRLHFVLCLNQRLRICPGAPNKPLRPEAMTTARYSWSGGDWRRGDVDFILLDDAGLEFNYAYISVEKIKQDFVKLLDAENQFREPAYVVFGHSPLFRERIEQGYSSALSFLMAKHGVMCITQTIDVILVEDLRDRRGRGSLRVWESNAKDLRGALEWHEILL